MCVHACVHAMLIVCYNIYSFSLRMNWGVSCLILSYEDQAWRMVYDMGWVIPECLSTSYGQDLLKPYEW